MKALVIAVALLCGAPALADHDEPDVEQRLDRVALLLDRAMNEDRPRKRDRLMQKARREVEALRRELRRAPPPPPATQPAYPPQPVVYPMDPAAFDALKRAVRTESFPRDQLRVIASAAPAHWFLTEQVRELLAQFTFPRDRLEAARLLRPRILDVENYYRLYASFEFPSDKAQLKQILDG